MSNTTKDGGAVNGDIYTPKPAPPRRVEPLEVHIAREQEIARRRATNRAARKARRKNRKG